MTDEPRGFDRLPEDLLSAYVDGEITEAERAAVEARVASDAAWQHILADVVAARDAVRALPDREPPTGFWLRVLTRVAEEAEQDRAAIAAAGAVVPITRPAPRRVPRWGAISAAVVAVVAGVALAMPQRNHAVSPKIATLTNQHAAASSSGSDPITNLAPAAVPVGLTP
jgi:anti-sigma factor RsiW